MFRGDRSFAPVKKPMLTTISILVALAFLIFTGAQTLLRGNSKTRRPLALRPGFHIAIPGRANSEVVRTSRAMGCLYFLS